MTPLPSLSGGDDEQTGASWHTLLSVQMVRLDELRGMLHQRRLATDARDQDTGEALTDAVDELDACVTDAKIAQEAKVSAWMATIPQVSFAC